MSCHDFFNIYMLSLAWLQRLNHWPRSLKEYVQAINGVKRNKKFCPGVRLASISSLLGRNLKCTKLLCFSVKAGPQAQACGSANFDTFL